MSLFPPDTARAASATYDAALDRRVQRTFIGGFESTYLPGADVDVAELSGGVELWTGDLDRLERLGVTRVRYPLRWHRIAQEPGRFDWSQTDAEMEHLRSRGFEPIVDLVHHTSYPRRLDLGFADARFAGEYLRYVEAVAARYPWLPAYTLFNEPFATLFLSGHQALWPPYESGMTGFVRVAGAVLPALAEAAGIFREALPHAEHVWVDTCEAHSGTPGAPARFAEFADDRRHLVLDLLLGQNLDPERPAVAALVEAGGEALLHLPPITVDVLGLDYYPHSEWWYTPEGGSAPSPAPRGFASVAADYAERYGLPLILAETNIRGLPTDRVTWLRYMLEQYEQAVDAGVPLCGFTWFPLVDSTDWDSLLARATGRRDPVGVWHLGARGRRSRTVFTTAWELAAAGASVDALPAYRLQAPCDQQLRGYVAGLHHWPWQDAPDPEPPIPAYPAVRDLVVLSHLDWDWVWQRPQHLVTRFASARAARGARTWFVEEPIAAEVDSPTLALHRVDDVTRVRMLVPADSGYRRPRGYSDAASEPYGPLLHDLLVSEGITSPDVLVYTPMALNMARMLDPHTLAYDVMDDLASFADAPEGMLDRQSDLLESADVVFAGGRSLHRSVADRRPDCHLFASGVDVTHYAKARRLRGGARNPRPVAGYVGVLDERLDLDLVAGLARALPDWTIRMVGPVAKITPASLPAAANIEYPGMASYAQLPEIMAGVDVAIMPFALNEATRSISPTKTLEYLAAGLPVVSTRVADVVADYGDIVSLADDAAGFAARCRAALDEAPDDRDRLLQIIDQQQSWDAIARRMGVLLEVPAGRSGWATADPAHRDAREAAIAGLMDAGLGAARLEGPLVPTLAEAAVTSATPFLRAPLLARLAAVQRLHPPSGDESGVCPSCGATAPCETALTAS